MKELLKDMEGEVINLKTPEGRKEFSTYYKLDEVKIVLKRDGSTLILPITLYLDNGKIIDLTQGVKKPKGWKNDKNI